MENMKLRKIVITSGIFLLCILFFISPAYADFWASKNSNKYHYPNCRWAQKINPKNLIVFKTTSDAIKAGYVPCKVCRPPGK